MPQQDPSFHPSKKAFLKTWPTGYSENFVIYTQQCGSTERDVVSTCLEPFYDKDGVALEIGCGNGYFTTRYLLPNFKHVIAMDLLPPIYGPGNGVANPKLTYIELPDRSYNCPGVDDASVDFVFQFGCFCHLPLAGVEEYVKNVFRVLKPGKFASLFFSNTQRRAGSGSLITKDTDPEKSIMWLDMDFPRTKAMLEGAGFVDVIDRLPNDKNTMAIARKPKCC